MAPESGNNLRLEIGHVLFIDLVGYSKLLIEEQKERVSELTEIVLATAQVREAPDEQLVRLPTGDGMALVFRNSSEEPARCALEIAEALKKHPEIAVRMGIHSGPVSDVSDVSGRTNIAGAGINMAQRVMDCGDTGHILLSQRVADDLAQYRQWSPRLHDLGECEVKHGVRVSIVNLYTDEVGNSALPTRFADTKKASRASGKRLTTSQMVFASLVALIFLGIPALIFTPAILKSRRTSANIEAGRPVDASLTIPEKSIAVLPFANLSEEKSNAYFANGIQDEILTRLAKIGTLKVISRASTERYKAVPDNIAEIARQLGVAHLLEGSVQRADKQVRVNVQLIKASDGSHLWAETYDRNLDDIFRVETEVATAVADKLQAAISGREQQALTNKPTVNLDAYDAYLRGLDFDRRSETAGDLRQAADYLKKAVELDPNFALAWARLGQVKSNLFYQDVDVTPAARASAEEAVQKARRLAPELAEPLRALGYFQFYCERDLKKARTAFEAARERLPNDSDLLLGLSLVDLHQGDAAKALVLQNEALQIDPRNPLLFYKKAQTLAALRRFPEARAAADLALRLTPNDPELLSFKGCTFVAEGDLERAARIFDSLQIDPTDSSGVMSKTRIDVFRKNYPGAVNFLRSIVAAPGSSDDLRIATFCSLLGQAQQSAGDLAGARASFGQGRDIALGDIEQSGGPQGRIHSVLAVLQAGLGEKENALREAHRAVELEGDDEFLAPAAREILARVEMQVGDPSRALDLLPDLLKANSFSWITSPSPLTPALLRLDPIWDPIRKDPRFQKLASAAP